MNPNDDVKPLDEGANVYVPQPPEHLTDDERILWQASLGALQGPYSVETAPGGTMSRIMAPDALDATERELVADFLYGGCARYFSLLEPEAVRGLLAEVSRLRSALAFYAGLGPDDVPYADTINDPPDVGRVARAALSR